MSELCIVAEKQRIHKVEAIKTAKYSVEESQSTFKLVYVSVTSRLEYCYCVLGFGNAVIVICLLYI